MEFCKQSATDRGMSFAFDAYMVTNESDPHAVHPPLAQLEESFIHEYLVMRGYDPHDLQSLSEHERDLLLKEASVYASGKLSEFELRSQFVHELHDAIGDVPKAGKA